MTLKYQLVTASAVQPAMGMITGTEINQAELAAISAGRGHLWTVS
jgi:hypothetical protein